MFAYSPSFPYQYTLYEPDTETSIRCDTQITAKTLVALLNAFSDVWETSTTVPANNKDNKLLFWPKDQSQPIVGYYAGDRFWANDSGSEYTKDEVEKFCFFKG